MGISSKRCGLITIISAYDLGYIDLNKAISSIQKTIETIEKLTKWNGQSGVNIHHMHSA